MPEESSGLLGSVKRLTSTLTDIVSARLELLANELHEERLHISQILLYEAVALFCFGVAVLLIVAFIVVLFWEEHRLGVLAGLGALFLLLGSVVIILKRKKVRSKSKLFSVSLSELRKDREQLGAGNE